jgi:phosphohistidine swiveling domain-containing protein
VLEEYVLDAAGPVRVQGRSVGARIASGAVRRVVGAHALASFRPGEVLVADTTTPDWEPVMKTAAAIVTNRGGRTCHAAIVALECAVLKRVRGEMDLTNLKLMVPFCRRLDEARRVLDLMARHGLQRGVDGLEVYMMCEIPNNVLLIDEFSALFDGFSIGSNDLTQLTLGVDRDSAVVADSFDERDPGMLRMLQLAVEGARRNGRHSGICGQAPSDHVEIAECNAGRWSGPLRQGVRVSADPGCRDAHPTLAGPRPCGAGTMIPMRALSLTVLLAVAGAATAQTCPTGTTRQTGGTPADPTGGGNFTGLITGATICAARGNDRWQEYHRAGGALIDFKRGPNDRVDPTRQVGTWTVTHGANATVTHTYGPQSSSFTWALCRVNASNPVTYTMVSPTAGTITGVRVLAGQVACP